MAGQHSKGTRSTAEYKKLKRYYDRHPELQIEILQLRQAEEIASSDYPDLDSQSEMWCWRVLYLFGKSR